MPKFSKTGNVSSFVENDDIYEGSEQSYSSRISRHDIMYEKKNKDKSHDEKLHDRKSSSNKDRENTGRKILGHRSKEPSKLNIDSIIEEECRHKAFNESASIVSQIRMIEIPTKAKVGAYMPGVLSAVRETEAKLDWKASPDLSERVSSKEISTDRERPTVDQMGFVVNQKAAFNSASQFPDSFEERTSKSR